MSKNHALFNTFQKGLFLDSDPSVQPEGTYRYALNAMTGNGDQDATGLVNEMANLIESEIGEKIAGYTFIEVRNKFLIFTKSSKISWWDPKSKKYEVIKDGAGCGWNFGACEYIYAKYKRIGICQELHIYWSSGCKYYYANVDALLDPNRADQYKCEDFELMKCDELPIVTATKTQVGGGGLPNGSYYFSVALEDEIGTITNYGDFSERVNIGGGDNIPGEPSGEYIKVHIKNLPSRFNKIHLIVAKRIKGATTYEQITTLNYTTEGITYDYRGTTGDEETLDESELIRKSIYIRGQDLEQKDNRLYLYNVLPTPNLDYQQRANNIQVQGVLYKVPASKAHLYPSLQRWGRYLFAIVFNYCDGTTTKAFPLSSSGGGGGSSSSSSSSSLETRSSGNSSASGSYEPPEEKYTTLEEKGDLYYPNGKDDRHYDKDGLDNKYYKDFSDAVDEAPEASDGVECPECQPAIAEKTVNSINKVGAKISEFVINLFNRRRKDKKASKSYDDIKKGAQDILDELKKQEEFVPERTKYMAGSNQDSPTDPALEARDNPDLYKVGEFGFKTFNSQVTYPLTKNCEGEYVYGGLAGTPIRLLEVPGADELHHFLSYVNGVKSQKTLDADPLEGYVYLIGLKVSGVEIPTLEETGKPLSENNPYKIVYAERNDVNNNVIAEGIFVHTFEGDANGRTVAVTKHAVNSIEYVDRSLQSGGDDFNKLGRTNSSPIYAFFSPDTEFDTPVLDASEVKIAFALGGTGWRHGQYAVGKDPGFWRRQVDQRGTRQSVNLNKIGGSGGTFKVQGIGYAPADQLVENPRGISKPLLNLYKERCVFLEADSLFPSLPGGVDGGQADHSFVGDGKVHAAPIQNAQAWYGALLRDLPSQYGSVVNQNYIDIGLRAEGSVSSVEGLVGDVSVNVYSMLRTSYVSNKVGSRTITPSPRRVPPVLWFFGIGDCTELPESGDTRDAKNLACLRPDADPDIRPGAPPTFDTYFPRTLKTLLHFPVESKVNVYYRQRGNAEDWEVHYRNLKPYYLDSSLQDGAWENCWLNQFFDKVLREAPWQAIIRNLIRTIIILGTLAFLIAFVIKLASTADIALLPIRLLLWFIIGAILLVLFSNRNINRMLGLKECLNDDQGGQDIEAITNWITNYSKYSSDYNASNDHYAFFGMPDIYNTCQCDDCEQGETTNEVYYSDPQPPDSEVDVYHNFQSNNFFDIPAHAGKLKRLLTYDNRLWAHTSKSLWIVQHRDAELALDGRVLTLQGGSLLVQPQELYSGINEGYGGTIDPNAGIITPYGYIFIDRKAGKIFQLTSQLEDLTIYGMRNFFRNKLDFCSEGTCIDEKVGKYYELGFDPRHNRLLVTKHDGDYTFTLSFDFVGKRWVSEHSYKPQFYMWDRLNFYSYKDDFYKHHQTKKFQEFYGQSYPFIVEYVANGQLFEDSQAFEYKSLTFNTDAVKRLANGDLFDRKVTFNKGIIYNRIQSSGLLDFEQKDSNDLLGSMKEKHGVAKISRQEKNWRVNEFYDSNPNRDVPIVTQQSCEPFGSINTSNIEYDNSYKTSILLDKYVFNRLIFDNFEDSSIQLTLFHALNNINYPQQ